MGILFEFNRYFCDSNFETLFGCCLFNIIMILGCMIYFFIMGNQLNNKEHVYDFGFISYNYLFKNIFKFAIYGIAVFVFVILGGLISLIAGKNYIKRIFNCLNFKIFKKKLYSIIVFISIIDILNLYLLNRLVSKYAIVDLITDYFTEPFFLLYMILYYYIFKNAKFKKRQIISSFIFFSIGIICTIIGLSLYYCDDLECQDYPNNYFRDYNISIIIAVVIIPFFYFLRILLSAFYMESTECNALVLNFHIYFIECILSIIIFYISNILIYKKKKYSSNFIYWIAYAVFIDIYELIIFVLLRMSNIFLIFMILVFRKVVFHSSMTYARGDYFLFLIGPIFSNILGLITFSCHSDKDTINTLNLSLNPLFPFEDSIIESDKIKSENKYNEPKNFDNKKKENLLSNNAITSYRNDNNNFTPSGDDKERFFEEIEELKNENNILKNENNKLKSEINELKAKNQNQHVKIGTLQVKIQNLEELNEKLSEKIAILKDKTNSNNDELDNYN